MPDVTRRALIRWPHRSTRRERREAQHGFPNLMPTGSRSLSHGRHLLRSQGYGNDQEARRQEADREACCKAFAQEGSGEEDRREEDPGQEGWQVSFALSSLARAMGAGR